MIMELLIAMIIIRTMKTGDNSKKRHVEKNKSNGSGNKNINKSENNINSNNKHNKSLHKD